MMLNRALAGSSRSARNLLLGRLPAAAVNVRHNSTAAPPSQDEGEQRIYNKLKERFVGGQQLQVQDVSGGCGSFYAILISSPEFKGLSMVKQHKMVNEALGDEFKGLHGLQLKTIAEE